MAAVGKGLTPLLIGLMVWQILGDPHSAVLPPPSTWWTAVMRMASGGTLRPALIATLWTLVASLVVASAVGLAFGLLIGTMRRFRQWTGWLLEYFRAIPPPVIIPIMVLLLGYTGLMKIVVIGFAAIWPVLLNTISGAMGISPLMYDVGRSNRLTRAEMLLKIVLPATAPAFLLGVKVALPHAVIVTLVVEMFTGAVGLGGLMIGAERNFNAAGVFGLLVLVGILGTLLNAGFAAVERYVVRRWPVRGGMS
jgi:ABC-type nitrate/sulfonate/bicarbonate transport system permease component